MLDEKLKSLIESRRIISPLDLITKYKQHMLASANDYVLALAIQDANMSISTKSRDNMCIEMGLEAAVIQGDVTFPFHFDFQTHLYSFVTCAGQTDRSNSLGIVFTPLHWNVLVFIIFCLLLLLALLSFDFGRFNLSWISKMSISLILGSVGCEVVIRRKFVKTKTLIWLLVLWSFIGIMIGNLYQARLTQSLISPLKYNQNLSLVELIDGNFKILLIPRTIMDLSAFESSPLKDLPIAKYSFCVATKFCKQLLFEKILSTDSLKKVKKMTVKKTTHCISNPWNCPHIFSTGKLNVLKLFERISLAINYSSLVRQLSSCEKNTVFVHNRLEMYKVVKPKLPKISRLYRRKFKYLPFSDRTVKFQVYACFLKVENLVKPILKRYLEYGLYTSWVNLVSLLIFRWNTGTTEHGDDLANTIVLDEKFLGIIFVGLSAYAFSIAVLSCELIFSHRKANTLTQIFLCIKSRARKFVEYLMLQFGKKM